MMPVNKQRPLMVGLHITDNGKIASFFCSGVVMNNFSAPEHSVESLGDTGQAESFLEVGCGTVHISRLTVSDNNNNN